MMIEMQDLGKAVGEVEAVLESLLMHSVYF